MKLRDIPVTDIVVAVSNSYSMRETLRNLGLGTVAEGRNSRKEAELYIRALDISMDHFLPKGNPNKKARVKYTDDILFTIHVGREGYSHGTINKRVKRRLMELGKEYKCDCCGISEWNNKPITLQLEHVNGNRYDYRKENLSFLCPNCHSQTVTFSSTKKGTK